MYQICQSMCRRLTTNVSECCKVFAIKLFTRMSSKCTYEDAVHKLNSLQSNKSTLEQIRKDLKNRLKCTNLEDMENYLARTGVPLSKLDELSVIHIAGTKGKGSTSAMCESILRHHGYRTGFFSSPHLVAVRERIRLEGRVVTKEKFAKYFHEVYDKLDGSKAFEGDMPKYFAFLTVLAFNMFLKEEIEVAIVEVGIGGIVDYTNVLRKVPIVGMTALGLDHTSILGNTLTQIAEAKAGIMKPGCEAYSVAQPPEAMEVLRRVAAKVQCTLSIVPEYKKYTFPNNDKNQLQVNLEAYQMNASLAIQLAHAWMRTVQLQSNNRFISLKKYGILRQNVFATQQIHNIDTLYEPGSYNHLNGNTLRLITRIPKETDTGLRRCKWPGRYQVIQSDYACFYLDGAHTKESMEICAHWFTDNSRYEDKILIFSATGDRNAEVLLKPLKNSNFRKIYFVIPTAYKNVSEKNDNYSIMEHEELISRCRKHEKIWKEFNNNPNITTIFECVSDTLIDIKQSNSAIRKPSVLITGSLHLVGAALSILDPNLNKD